MQRLREVFARSPPGTHAEGSLQTPNLEKKVTVNKSSRKRRYKLTLKPVGHQSTNWIVRLVLMLATAACTSLGTTSPRYSKQQATNKDSQNANASANYEVFCAHCIYPPWGRISPFGYHSRSKRRSSQPQNSAHGWLYRQRGEARMWRAGNEYGGIYEALLDERFLPLDKKDVTHGTRLVWNSFKSTLREPSKRRDAVMDETT